jgi:hypothetical protein
MIAPIRYTLDFRFFAPIKVIFQEITDNTGNSSDGLCCIKAA